MIFLKKSLLLMVLLQCSMLFAARSKAEEDEAKRKQLVGIKEEADKVNTYDDFTNRPISISDRITNKIEANERNLQDLLCKNIAKRMAEADKEYAKMIAIAAKNEEKESPFKRYKHACIMADRARTELERRKIFDFDFLFLKESNSIPQELIEENNEAKARLEREIEGFEQKISLYKPAAQETVDGSVVTKECQRYAKELRGVFETSHKQFKENERKRQEMRYQEHEFYRKHLKYLQATVEQYKLRLVKMNLYRECANGTMDNSVDESILEATTTLKDFTNKLNKGFKASRTTGRFNHSLI